MFDESAFHRQADDLLSRLTDALEAADAAGEIDMELAGGILQVALPEGKTYLINKHAASRQIWVSSPLSGGLHFAWDETKRQWMLPEGMEIGAFLRAELRALGGIVLDLKE